MDGWVVVEGVGEYVGFVEALVHPLTTIGDGHETTNDLGANAKGLGLGLLSGTDILAIGGVVGHQL